MLHRGPGLRFLEWGAATGVITIIADLLGFDALRLHGHIKFFSRKTIEKALTEAGFTGIQFAGAGRIPWAWKSMVLKAVRPA